MQGPVQARFNRHHSRARCIIETSFGRMKARWRAIFLQTLPLDRLIVPKVVTACAMLHNICLGVGDVLDEAVPEPVGRVRPVDAVRSVRRDELAALISVPEQRHNLLQDHDYIWSDKTWKTGYCSTVVVFFTLDCMIVILLYCWLFFIVLKASSHR